MGNSPKDFPFRSKTIYERCFLACICWYENVRFSAITGAYGRFMLAFWLTYGYFNVYSNNVNKKTNKKALFLVTEDSEIFLDRIDTVFFRHGLTRINTDSSIVSNRGLARIKGKKLKNLCQSLGFSLRLCNLADETENAPETFCSRKNEPLRNRQIFKLDSFSQKSPARSGGVIL